MDSRKRAHAPGLHSARPRALHIVPCLTALALGQACQDPGPKLQWHDAAAGGSSADGAGELPRIGPADRATTVTPTDAGPSDAIASSAAGASAAEPIAAAAGGDADPTPPQTKPDLTANATGGDAAFDDAGPAADSGGMGGAIAVPGATPECVLQFAGCILLDPTMYGACAEAAATRCGLFSSADAGTAGSSAAAAAPSPACVLKLAECLTHDPTSLARCLEDATACEL